MPLRIQDPFDPDTKFLLEAILEACQGASHGAGAFAFASAAGVRLLMGDRAFRDFAASGTFDLVVGVDSVTNVVALEALQTAADNLATLNVRAFLHDKRGALFHPKFCWFRTGEGAILIAGSGNLTTGGLRGNWEAFSLSTLDNTQASVLEEQWSSWKASVSPQLKLLNNPDVIAQAASNIVIRTRSALTTAPNTEEEVVTDENEAVSEGEIFLPDLGDKVLIATIPNSGDRWKQANFTRDNFRDFFGVGLGSHQRVLLYHVSSNGELGVEESRPVVSVQSNNHRLELEAASGLPYPSGSNRPIAVFLRVATRTFRYRLLMPNDSHYTTVASFLNSQYEGPPNRVPRVMIDAAVMRENWPDSPLWLAN